MEKITPIRPTAQLAARHMANSLGDVVEDLFDVAETAMEEWRRGKQAIPHFSGVAGPYDLLVFAASVEPLILQCLLWLSLARSQTGEPGEAVLLTWRTRYNQLTKALEKAVPDVV